MQNTINYSLKKPESADYIDINDFNENADIIDIQLKENADGLTSLEKTAATKEEVQTLSETVSAYKNETAASITETGEKLDAAATKQAEILTGVNGVKTDTTAIKSDTATIKTNTQNILAKFPISGGVDWSAKTPKGVSARTASTSLVSIVSVSGKGYLTGISQFIETATGYFGVVEVIIDGVTIVSSSYRFCGYGASGTFNSIMRFNKSLVVKHKSHSDSYGVNTKVFYLLD